MYDPKTWATQFRAENEGHLTPIQEIALDEIERGHYNLLLQEAASSADFPYILRNTMFKQLLKEYKELPSTWQDLASAINDVNDFKDQYRERVSEADLLEAVIEHGEYRDSALAEEEIKYNVQKYGRIFGISWECIINDDLHVLRQQPIKMGRAAKRSLDKDIITYITGNPTIYDGATLFASDHGNVDTGVNVITEAKLADGYKAIRTQKDLRNENVIGMTPRYLLIGPEQEVRVLKVLNARTVPITDGTITAAGIDPGTHMYHTDGVARTHTPNEPNFFQIGGKLEIRISNWLGSDEWYLIADPKQYDTLEVGFLRGHREPEMYVENSTSGNAFNRDEIRYKIRHIWGKIILDYRPWYKGSNNS